MAIGKCLKCDKIAPMTEDHVFPKWLRKALPNFGLKVPENLGSQLICQECNTKKGGNLDYSDEATREFVKQLVVKFAVEIRKFEEFTF